MDTSDGFELCPADVCSLDLNSISNGPKAKNKFSIIEDFSNYELIESYTRFLSNNGIDTAGIEFVANRFGEIYTYDVNTNTNYNSQAEIAANVPLTGMEAVARYLSRELQIIEDFSEEYVEVERLCV